MNSFEKLEPIYFTKIENKLDFKQKCLRMPVFKDEEKDELLNNNYSHLINSSIIIEESTNQSNIEENKISKNIICKESNIKIESFQTIQSSKELKNENIMIGRKRLNEQKTGRHNKYIDDNVRRKCKHIILEILKAGEELFSVICDSGGIVCVKETETFAATVVVPCCCPEISSVTEIVHPPGL
jgi:hypothetical protein